MRRAFVKENHTIFDFTSCCLPDAENGRKAGLQCPLDANHGLVLDSLYDLPNDRNDSDVAPTTKLSWLLPFWPADDPIFAFIGIDWSVASSRTSLVPSDQSAN